MGVHRASSRIDIKQFVGAALAAGGLLLAVPSATALAAPPPGGGSGGTDGTGNTGGGSTLGVNNRPSLARPAPGVEAVQRAGDKVFNADHAKLDASGLGTAYHKVYGSAGDPQDGNGTVDPGEAYQGTWTGFLNTPGALERAEKRQAAFCARNPESPKCAN